MEILKHRFKQRSTSLFGFLLSALFLITACEKDAKVKLPAISPKLVIVSFISPQDTIIRVDLTLSEPLYNNAENNKYKAVEDAIGTISSELGSATLVYDPAAKYYKLDSALLKVRAGITYTVYVSTPDGKSAQASTRIPPANNTLDLGYTPDSLLKITWSDPPETVDYYRLFSQSASYYIFEGYTKTGEEFADTIYSRYVTADWYPDTEASNGTFTKVTGNRSYLFEDTYIYLLHVSKEYYEYGIRLDMVMNATDNPFSEPVPMFSNVDGGFGIFAGYNSIKKKVP